MDVESAAHGLRAVDIHPGDTELKKYWLHGEGAARWKSWTDLYHHLLQHMMPNRAKRIAAAWFHERYGIWPGDKMNRSAAAPLEYGGVALGADAWLNDHVQPILTHGLPPSPEFGPETRSVIDEMRALADNADQRED